MKQNIQIGSWLFNHLVLLLSTYVYLFFVFLFTKATEPTWFFQRGGERLEGGGWEGEYFLSFKRIWANPQLEYISLEQWAGCSLSGGLQALTVPPAVTVTDNVTENVTENDKMLKKEIRELFSTADPVWFISPEDKWNFFGSLFFCCTVFTTVGKYRSKVTRFRINSYCCFL